MALCTRAHELPTLDRPDPDPPQTPRPADPERDRLLSSLVDSVQTAAMSKRTSLVVADATVWVRDQAWTRTESLPTAGPNDAVFEVDADSGQVSFGDGVHGARPPEGAMIHVEFEERDDNPSIVSVTLRRTAVPPTSDQSLWVAIRSRAGAIEFSMDETCADNGARRRPARRARLCSLMALAAFAVGWIIGGRCSASTPARSVPSI